MRESAGIPFGSYVLLKRLARGGMAEVFLGRQRGLQGFDRLVAVKRVLPHLADSQEFIRMFFDEARLAAKLSHPNVVHIYEFGKVGHDYFIAMEYVHGVHAGQLIAHAAREAIPAVLIARLGADACAGLHYAHELRDEAGRWLDLVHRDVSPPNLLISYDGTTKLVDFGIAKAAISVEQTRPGVVKGKYAYMSPEQTVGRKLTSRSDVFSLALVMWELLAGQVAVERDDKVAAMKIIRDGKLPPIEGARPDIAPALSLALTMAMQIDPEQRFSALEFKVALEEYIKTQPVLGSSIELGQWILQRFPWESPTGDHELDNLLTRATAATRSSLIDLDGLDRPTFIDLDRNETPRLDDERATIIVDKAHKFLQAVTIPTPSPVVQDMDDATMITDAPPGATLSSLPDAPRRPEVMSPITAMAASIQPMPSRPDPHARLKTIGIAAGAAIVLGVVVLAVVSGDEASRPASAQPAPAINPPPRTGPTREVGAFDGGAVPVPAVLAAIEVIVEPAGAQVTLEGREPAPAPAVFEGLAPGTYRVTVTRNGFIPLERTITVTAGEHRSLDLSMIPVAAPLRPPSSGSRLSPSGLAVKTRPDNRPGQLIVRTVPYSVAYLEGKKFDTTPFTRELKPGRYTMTFRHPKFPPRARTVTIRPGKKTKLVFELK